MSDDNLFGNEDTTPEEDAFVNDLEAQYAGYLNVNPEQIVTIRSTSGQGWPVPVTEPTSIRTLITGANLTMSADTVAWLDGAQVNMDTVVAGGSVVTLVGQVKGG